MKSGRFTRAALSALREMGGTADDEEKGNGTVRQLLHSARHTAFGQKYQFPELLRSGDIARNFARTVPIHDYLAMQPWWQRSVNGEANITWPGKARYFALSSGTSDASSKHIPVTSDMLRCVRRFGFRQLTALTAYPVSPKIFSTKALLVGGSTSLTIRNGFMEGDMSGISRLNTPAWLSKKYIEPGVRIASMEDWSERIDAICKAAPRWDIGIVCGIPSWVQIVLAKIVSLHGAANIHEIWPNFSMYIHGGVAYDSYDESLRSLYGREVIRSETYMASEGCFAFRSHPDSAGMRLQTDLGVHYEFVPFDSAHFSPDGELNPEAEAVTIDAVEEGKEYALVISTCSGAWRYLIGDVIRFTDLRRRELVITGRTRQFINVCGEHVSIDNLVSTVAMVSQRLDLNIREFAVAPVAHEGLFAYRWFIGCDNIIDEDELARCLDKALCELNDDYRVERSAAIRKVSATVTPPSCFGAFLLAQRRDAMSKFPRVLKGDRLIQWENFLQQSTAGVGCT